MKERLEDEKGGWRNLQEKREIDLGDYRMIEEPEDWTKGTEKALNVILERVEASEGIKERAEKFMKRVDSSQREFSGKNRICVAAAITYFAFKGKIDKKELSTKASISIASLRNMIETMSNAIDLN